MNVLFVCHANMCRSALAEGLAKKLASERSFSEQIVFRSAGLAAREGLGALPEAVQVAAAYGVDLSEHVTTPLSLALGDWADYLVVATRAQKREVLARFPMLRPRLYTLAEFVGEITGRRPRWQDLPDPVGRSEREYVRCAERIYDSLVSVLDVLAGVAEKRRGFLVRMYGG